MILGEILGEADVKKVLGLMMAASLMQTNIASAVGIADFVSAGINVIGKVGGAAIDKAMEDSPEEMESKRQKERIDREAKFHEAIAKIEARTDMTPLDKEKLTRQVSKTMGMAETISNFAAQQELNRRAQRDQMFTAGGMAGVVGDAALSTPSAIMARADIAVKTGAPQAESRRAIAGANDLMKTGRPQAQSRAAVEAAMTGGAVRPTVADVQLGGSPEDRAKVNEGVANIIAQHQGEIDKAKAEIEAAKPKELLSEPEPTNLASLDKGRKIYVEFVGGKKLTELLQLVFKDSGHTVVASAAEAEVLYQFDGEYAISPEGRRDGLIERVGAYSDNTHPLEAPKEQSSMKNAVGGFLASMAGLQVRPTSGIYRQAVLMVVNRHFDGKDARVSAILGKEHRMLEPDMLIVSTLHEICKIVGISPSRPIEAYYNDSVMQKKNI